MASPITWTTAMFDLPGPVLDATLDFWLGLTGSALSAWRGEDLEYATLLPPDGDPYLRVQRTVAAAPRLHLDLHIAADPGYRAVADSARSLAATVLHEAPHHVVLASPGGYVFCLVRDHGEQLRPAPLLTLAGATRVDQLTLDVPAQAFEAEVSFWSELTGWAAHRGSREEFVVLERQPGMPLRLMLQRIADPTRSTLSSHLDLAVGPKRSAVTAQHLTDGARLTFTGQRWNALTDPAGSPYCLTDRDPSSGLLEP